MLFRSDGLLPPGEVPPGIETPWCEEHDLPMRLVRTGDDRIVCWLAWSVLVGGDQFLIEPCAPGVRLVNTPPVSDAEEATPPAQTPPPSAPPFVDRRTRRS